MASLLHDIGLTKAYPGDRRFEVEGADAARALAKSGGVGDRRAQLVWYCVALNTTLWISPHAEPEVGICTVGPGGLRRISLRPDPEGERGANSRRFPSASDEAPAEGVPVRHRTGEAADHLRELPSRLRGALRRWIQAVNLDRGPARERPVR